MKAVISNRIYLNVPDNVTQIMSTLTYKFVVRKAMGGRPALIETYKNYKLLNNNTIISIPRGRIDLIPSNYEIIDKTVTNDVPFPEPAHELYPDQLNVYDKVEGSCFVNAKVGWGKTFTALHIARKLHQKTLIITHNTGLTGQWEDEITELFGLRPSIITSGRLPDDLDDSFITVGNIQTLRKYALELSKVFGTIIVDEAHHTPAETFTEFLDQQYSTNLIGLSGTMTRPDGKHALLSDYFGHQVFQPPISNTLEPVIRIYTPGISFDRGMPWAALINALQYSQEYQAYIASIAANKILEGHKVLIIGDRVEFLTSIQNRLGDSCVLIAGKDVSFEDRKNFKNEINSGAKLAVAGIRQIFSEGMSYNALSCVILATPIASTELLEQIIGRIQRKFPNKKTPEVIDINIDSLYKQNTLRLGFYMEQGWRVIS